MPGSPSATSVVPAATENAVTLEHVTVPDGRVKIAKQVAVQDVTLDLRRTA